VTVPAVSRAFGAAGLVLLLAGCGSAAPTALPSPSSPVAAPPPSSTSATSAPAVTSTSTSAPVPSPVSATPLATRPVPPPTTSPPAPTATPSRRLLVVLDPGHNGGNASHTSIVTRPVDAGNGTRKPCNEVGTESVAGYAEHAFTWDVVVRLRPLLAARGVDVRLTRNSDTGVGPCVDVRGRFGNALRADAVVSVHADGGPVGGSGFHVIEAARPAGSAAADHRLALAVRAALLAGSGLRYADYIAGGDGLDVRDDLAGLTLSARPSVLVEAGNMRNSGDLSRQASAAGRQRIAAALAEGIMAFLPVR
jgi:N-acetylmuramoyl-L-alanine amidase